MIDPNILAARAEVYRANAEEVPDPPTAGPAPHGHPIAPHDPNRRRTVHELREELAAEEQRVAVELAQQEASDAQRAAKARALDAATADAEAALAAIVAQVRLLLPGAEHLAAQVEAAEAQCLGRAYEIDGQMGHGTALHRLNDHPIQRLKPLLDMLRKDAPPAPAPPRAENDRPAVRRAG